MKYNLKLNKALAYYQLMRIDKPIGTLLLLWPTLWALWIATPGLPKPKILTVFFLAVWAMRSAGCVINDYIDRRFDGYVQRTANRPLPNDRVTKKEAYTIFSLLVLLSFLLVITLNVLTIILSFVALALTCIYPFMKRYTYFPQVVLGAAFSWSIPMSFAAVNESVPLNCWLMFLANILWVIAYDTQYAMMDYEDDIKISVKSTAIFFGCYDKFIIGILQVGVLILMFIIGHLNALNNEFYWALITTGMLFVYQQILISNRDSKSYLKAFMSNNYVGLILFLGLMSNF